MQLCVKLHKTLFPPHSFFLLPPPFLLIFDLHFNHSPVYQIIYDIACFSPVYQIIYDIACFCGYCHVGKGHVACRIKEMVRSPY